MFLFVCFSFVTGELSTLCQVAKVPNEPSCARATAKKLCVQAISSWQAFPKRGQPLGFMTTSRGSRAGHVLTQRVMQEKWQVRPYVCSSTWQLAVRCGRLNCRAKHHQVRHITHTKHSGLSKSGTRDTSKQSWMHFGKVGFLFFSFLGGRAMRYTVGIAL